MIGRTALQTHLQTPHDPQLCAVRDEKGTAMQYQRVAPAPSRRLLGVFAHPDDEVFCVGGTLAQWAAAGGETMILCATRGGAGQIQDARAATRSTLGSVREHELRTACAQLGVQHVECLDHCDGTLAEGDAATA